MATQQEVEARLAKAREPIKKMEDEETKTEEKTEETSEETPEEKTE